MEVPGRVQVGKTKERGNRGCMYDVGFKFGYDGPMRGCIVGVGK